jgi:hypothetical protein
MAHVGSSRDDDRLGRISPTPGKQGILEADLIRARRIVMRI